MSVGTLWACFPFQLGQKAAKYFDFVLYVFKIDAGKKKPNFNLTARHKKDDQDFSSMSGDFYDLFEHHRSVEDI